MKEEFIRKWWGNLMKLYKYKSEISKLEHFANNNQSAYKFKVFWLSILGYLYIIGVFILLIGLVAGLVGLVSWIGGGASYFILKLGLPVLLLLWIGINGIVRSLFMRIPKPDGITITRELAPLLFEMVDELQKRMDCPKIKHIILNDEYNAAVVQRPRIGSFGFYENYLIVGLPYMMSLKANQFKSVLAHEMGHISRSHGRFGGWIYRVRMAWYNIAEAMEEKEYKGSFVFKKFFEWYIPRLWAFTFVLARANEYEADEYSAKMTDSKTTASMLVSSTIYGAWLDEGFWKKIFKASQMNPEPPSRVFSKMRSFLHSEINLEKANEILKKALIIETSHDDTHPSLHDRLLALGEEAEFVPLHSCETAAEIIFGDSLEEVEDFISEVWKESITPLWNERFEDEADAKNKLAELDKKYNKGITDEEAYERASLIEILQGSNAALPVYQKVVTDNPRNLDAEFDVGRILIEQGSPDGIDVIEKVINKDISYAYYGYSLIHHYFITEGNKTKAEEYELKLYEQETLLDEAREERQTLSLDDIMIPHELNQEEIEKIRSQLGNFKRVKEAYLVRKQVKHFQSDPIYILGVCTKHFWLKEDYKFSELLAKEIDFPGEFVVCVVQGDNKVFRKEMTKIPGSRIL
jgi:Zn-dependent protease with chaperone function